MKKISKGQYRYLPEQFKWELLKTVLLFACAIGILVIGMVITMYRHPGTTLADSKNNILTVAAVLGLLPASRSLISLIMFVKARKYTCEESLYERIAAMQQEDQVLPVICYDMYLTAYDKEFPVYVMAATENELLGLLADKADANSAQDHIKESLLKDGQKNVTVKLYQDREKFLERLESAIIACKEGKDQELKKAASRMEVVLQISL